MLEVAAEAGHSVATCAKHYARIFEDYDPAKRSSAEVKSARESVQQCTMQMELSG